MGDASTILVGALALVAAGAVILWVWLGRYERRRVRQWCDENDYALLELKYFGLLRGLLRPRRGGFGGGTWRVRLRDHQGQIRTGWIHFGSRRFDIPWGEILVRWD